jgi:hypothetical protein
MRNWSKRNVVLQLFAVLAVASALLTSATVCVAESVEPADPAVQLATPTHHQTGLIKVNVDGLPNRSLECFCLTPDGRILAGLAGGSGEIRVIGKQGDYLESWTAPFEPEAIYARADGKVFLAGEGKVARLSSLGEVELEHQAPHTEAMGQDLDKIREEVISQNRNRAEVYVEQAKQYDQMLEQSNKQIAKVKDQIAALDKSAEDADKLAQRKAALERQLAMFEQMKSQYEQVKTQWDEMIAQNQPKELTDEEIDQLVKESIKYKSQASSISATNENVFLATHAAAGYGFDVWKLDAELTGGERIITGLSGCCGQMDVKADDDGLFVAENSKHRVCRYDSDGKLICQWGHGARQGIEGFGSCCNPMNVAFGPGGTVYTAEDTTGRIKRYSPDGELLGLVGKADLVPGCKNCAIAVSSDGSRVYMLDITRGHIVEMEPYKPGEAPAPTKDDMASDGGPNVGGAVANGLLRVLGYGD